MSSVSVKFLSPVPELLARVRGELSAMFDADRPVLVSRAPGRLDVMGGIADYTGSLVCELPLAAACAVATQPRDDGQVCVVSLNLVDEHQPFQVQVPAEALARLRPEELQAELTSTQPAHGGNDRRWAGYVLGCWPTLAEAGLLGGGVGGLNVALLSGVPSGAGVSSSAAVEVSTMMNLAARLGLITANQIDGPRLAALCQQVENRAVGAPCGLMDQMASAVGESGKLMRMVCQPHDLLPPLGLPPRTRVIGLNSNVRHSVGGGAYGRTRCAAFMGHALILAEMRRLGRAAGKAMTGDPTGGHLANLDADDYKRFFRPALPESMTGRAFLDAHGDTADAATTPEPDETYGVQAATDHHVLESRRVRQFTRFLEEATAADSPEKRGLALDKAGHLMYASHHSYGKNAGLGAAECDVLVELVRHHEPAGLYGAKITGGGSGGTVAVLLEDDARAADALEQVRAGYAARTGKAADLIEGTSPGAWHAGTTEVRL